MCQDPWHGIQQISYALLLDKPAYEQDLVKFPGRVGMKLEAIPEINTHGHHQSIPVAIDSRLQRAPHRFAHDRDLTGMAEHRPLHATQKSASECKQVCPMGGHDKRRS